MGDALGPGWLAGHFIPTPARDSGFTYCTSTSQSAACSSCKDQYGTASAKLLVFAQRAPYTKLGAVNANLESGLM